jgi:carbonic anhydrase/acetyltransferase-like protein (isoleucine patch superfamily)
MVHKSVVTSFSPKACEPQIDPTACIHPLAAVIGNVFIGRRVMVSPFASIRGDEGQPLFVGDESNVQDGVIIHALETEQEGRPVEKNLVVIDGKKYAVHIGEKVSLAHQAHIHGPSSVGSNTFVGMQSLVFRAQVGSNCVIEPRCMVMGVSVPDGRYVPAGTLLNKQEDALLLPAITDRYAFKDLNRGVVHVNVSLADGYNQSGIK